MTHSVTLVISRGRSIEEMLAPYNENIEVEPYWKIDARSLDEFWPARKLIIDGVIPADASTSDALAAVKRTYPGAFDDYRANEGQVEHRTTYNPKSRWDWYSVGGRWPDMLIRRDGSRCDSAYKRDLSLRTMREQARAAAGEEWDRVQRIAAEHPDPKEFLAACISEQVYPESDVRELTRDEYTELAGLRAVPGYALLDDEGYHEPGEMGWWGAHTDTPETMRAYLEDANRRIDEAPEDAVFTVVDVHI